MLCTWIPACYKQGEYRVERQTRPGLILDDMVCDKHLEDARRHGYRVREAIEPDAASRSADERQAP